MRIYVAAPFKDALLMPEIAQALETHGHKITHKWWIQEDAEENYPDEVMAENAGLDLLGVRSCEAMLLINSSKSEGKAVEQGIALALGRPIVALGDRGEHSKNVFHYLGNYKWVKTLDEALHTLKKIEKELKEYKELYG